MKVDMPKIDRCSFVDVSPGKCFKFDEKLWMRLDPASGGNYNGVSLETGTLRCFTAKHAVVKIDAYIYAGET